MSHFIFVRIHMSWRAAIAENRKTHREINIAKKSMKNWKIFSFHYYPQAILYKVKRLN